MPIPQLQETESVEPSRPAVPASGQSAPIRSEPAPPKRKRRGGRIVAVVLVVLFLALSVFVANAVVVGNRVLGGNGNVSIFDQIKHLISPPEQKLRGEADDRINVLLLGIGGPGHEGPLLTDTIIVASFRPSTNEVALLSIPRDLVVPFPTYEWRKINNALSFGQQLDYPGGGEALMRDMVQLVTNLPIHYEAQVDFSGFRQLVDALGGIVIDVRTAFVDSQYPTEDFGYRTIRFAKGPQKMDGARALEYVRSRHGSNGEGSDFARSRRQQKLLVAVKEKALSLGTLVNPKRISDVLSTVGQHAWSNLEVWEVLRFAKLAQDVQAANVTTWVLDDSPGSPLAAFSSPETGYILQPRGNTFQDVHFLAENLFTLAAADRENATVEIQNGTTFPGFADSLSTELARLNFSVVGEKNAPTRDYETSLIYDLTGGGKPNALAFLRKRLNAQVENGLPTFFSGNANLRQTVNVNRNSNTASTPVDFLVIVGTDQRTANPAAGPKLPIAPAAGRRTPNS